jgi:tetraacyldisaccharide 4'-kinase
MPMRAPDFWQRRGLASALLSPLGLLYGASVAAKARRAKPYRPNAKVLCIGNLTAGGSGKTPVALAMGQALQARGKKVFFLTRGYGGSARGPLLVKDTHKAAEVGDEALLLARVAPTIVARARAQGAAMADAQGADIIIMDDGYQNFTVAKDVAVVVVDAKSGFGNGRMIPAGPLREPVAQGVARADAVVMMLETGGRASSPPDLRDFAGPIVRARLMPDGESFRGRLLFAFAGIGRPEKFVASLKEAGAVIAGTQFFPDHHPYRPDEIAALKTKGPLVTTEKDYVRLTRKEREGVEIFKVAVVFLDDVEFLLDRLAPEDE